MLVLLPVLALGTTVLALKPRVECWREAILGGAVLWAVMLLGITELLSMLHALTAAGLAAGWLIALLAGAAVVLEVRPTSRFWHESQSAEPLQRTGPGARPPRFQAQSWFSAALLSRNGRSRAAWPGSVPTADWLTVALLGPLAAMVVLLGLIAVVSPPNTWDSMTYHMARLIHWSQNATLAPYPTHILRQLYLQPGAEFVLLQLQILSGGDHLAGLVQWGSMLGGLIGTSLIAHQLGAQRLGALCASIFAASVPIGILESTSTQNDYVVAFWLVCTAFFALRLMRTLGPGMPWLVAAAFGASAGLALLTKATAYLILLPFGLWVTAVLARRFGPRGLGLVIAAGAVAAVLNSGTYARNVVVFGTPNGSFDEGSPTLRYFNDAFSPPLMLSNLVRDVGVNFVATPVVAINVRTLNLVRLVHGWLGVSVEDPRTTWGGEVFREQPIGLAFDENFAGNPAHVVLVFAALSALWPLRRGLPCVIREYAVALVCSFALFVVVLRWQPWHTRLELPFFILAAPIVGTVADRISPRLSIVLAALLLASMVPWVAYNQARPLVGPRAILSGSRAAQYFTNQPDLASAYLGGVAFLAQRGCAQVGFTSTTDGWEYPLWPLLSQTVSGLEIEHVAVTNVSAAQASAKAKQFQPCAVFSVQPGSSGQTLLIGDRTFRPVWSQEPVAILTVDGR